MTHSVLVLGGGPDAEHDVSITSSQGVADALSSLPGRQVHLHQAKSFSLEELKSLPGQVVFPVLHGPFGEGGPLQDMLVRLGRPFVGCGPHAARLAMDKFATKLVASRLGIATAPAALLRLTDDVCPLPFPVVIKPVHEGSSVGVRFITDAHSFSETMKTVRREAVEYPGRVVMVETAILNAQELTVGILDGHPLAPVAIRPAEAFYDYHAKYHSEQTQYTVDPPLPSGMREHLQSAAVSLFREIGGRHLSRVDFLLDSSHRPWLLEINTMPGFTSHSLLPMAAAHSGLSFSALAERLTNLAVRDGAA